MTAININFPRICKRPLLILITMPFLLADATGNAADLQQNTKSRDYYERPYLSTKENSYFREDATKKKILDKKIVPIETGLEPMVNRALGGAHGPGAIWLNEDSFIVNAKQDTPDADEKKLQRVMLVDARTGTSKALFTASRLVCWSEELEIANFAELTYTEDTKRTFFHLDKNGNLAAISEPVDIDPFNCRSKHSLPPPSQIVNYLHESDGYIRSVQKGTPTDAAYIDKAIWHKADGTVEELPLRGSEISTSVYLAHEQKYLLNMRDSQGNSDTDRRLGAVDAWKNRQYSLTPYRLLGMDGSIEQIPYPAILFEYGIRYFGVLLPTRAGLLIVAPNSRKSEYGLFLLQEKNLVRVFGGPRLLGIDGREGVDKLSLSPDGCKIAFNLYSDWRALKKQIVIINLCEAK
ncbi:hypothetical protein [Undibacterium terreum]|uniref:WD40-like Beta Propeller Repeat n=1 Tax=Undibacterium terreum TaxID=1224302 RepID=A0A916UZ45_9BURK|nr:hypothetical protein [Undibacterium terreum]GGC93381.1 hypothetical protein GCM10011396_45820 [Undibacterium terreum]